MPNIDSPSLDRLLETLAASLVLGAEKELSLTPKPGLVDQHDSGAHPDLNYEIMQRSIGIVGDYLHAIRRSLCAGEDFSAQAALAIEAENCLYSRLGTNTHKGFIFLSGFLMIATARAGRFEEAAIRAELRCLAEAFFKAKATPMRSAPLSHGDRVRERYPLRGIVQEAMEGYPSVFVEALPYFDRARAAGYDERYASYAMFARLMQCVEDTTTLHRGGLRGLERLRKDGKTLEGLLLLSEVPEAWLISCNEAYIQDHLTLGGVADLLAISFAWIDCRAYFSVKP